GCSHKIAFQPASQVVTELRLATVKLNLTVHQIVHDLRVCGPGSNTDPSFPVPFRPPDGVVENLDSIGVPKLDPAIRPAGDKVVADHAVGDVGEAFTRAIRRGLAGIAVGHAPVTVDDEISFHHDVPGAHPDEDGRARAAVASFDVPENVVADGPVLQRHHVNGADVVSAEQPVGGRNPGVLENAIANRALHRARVRILSRRTLDRAHANVAEAAVVNVNALRRVLGFDLDPVRTAVR